MRAERGRWIEVALVAVLAGAVFAFGSTSYWARSILVAALAVLFTAWWLYAARNRPPDEFEPGSASAGLEIAGVKFRWSGLGIPAVLLLAAVLAQLVPIPGSVRAVLAPDRPGLERTVDGVLAGESAAGASMGWMPLSLRPGQTLDSLLLLVSYMLLFILVYNMVDSRQRLVRISRYLVFLGAAVAMIGLVQDLSGAEKIFGFKALRFGGAPYGPYVNHNHFAGLMEMTIPLAFGLLLRRVFRRSSTPAAGATGEPSGPGSAARRLLDADAGLRGERAGQALLLGLALTVMLAALLRSLSRGGLLALVMGGAAVMLILMVSGRLGRWEAGVLMAVAAAGVALFLWVGPGEALDHFRRAEGLGNEPTLGQRSLVWSATIDLFAGFPVLGAGLGTFPDAFLHYYPAGTERLWLQAHNDYVQVLAELGILGGVVVAYALLVFLVRLLSALVSRERVRERFIYHGLVAGILAMLIHTLVEFNLQVPANAACFIVICALALGQRNQLRRPAPVEA